MNQEELAEIKQMWGKCRGRTIRIVDQDQMDRLTFELHNEVPELLAHIDDQAGQIEALKEKLVEERAKTIATQELRESPEQAEEIGMRVTAGFSELPAWMTDHFRDVARQQLAEDPKLKAAGVRWE